MFTTELAAEDVNVTSIPAFDEASSKFAAVGASFTGIRHPAVVAGSEDNPYEIMNATQYCVDDQVERGVLARVIAELLKSGKAANKVCGVSSSSAFADAYLNILRSSGLTRFEEVEKVFDGGVQRVAQMTLDNIEDKKRRKQEAIEKREAYEKEQLEEERKAEAAMERNMALMKAVENSGQESDVDSKEYVEIETYEQKLERRTTEILKGVWADYNARMLVKKTTKDSFMRANRGRATALAEQELADSVAKQLADDESQKERERVMERMIDTNRKQFGKLLALEKKELQNQKDISDTWVRYVFLLLEMTMKQCKDEDVLFHNMDEFAQTMLLRKQANVLREMCSLSPYEVVYDPIDAQVIVEKLGKTPLGLDTDLMQPIDDVVRALNTKYGPLLKDVSVSVIICAFHAFHSIPLFVKCLHRLNYCLFTNMFLTYMHSTRLSAELRRSSSWLSRR
jgi:hypothetical protein